MSYKAFAVAAGENTHQCDAGGAFIPGAQKFAHAFSDGSYKTFNNLSNAKRNFLDAIEQGPSGLDLFAYFGHGYKTQLGSASIYTEKDIDEFARILRPKRVLQYSDNKLD